MYVTDAARLRLPNTQPVLYLYKNNLQPIYVC